VAIGEGSKGLAPHRPVDWRAGRRPPTGVGQPLSEHVPGNGGEKRARGLRFWQRPVRPIWRQGLVDWISLPDGKGL